MKVYIQSKSGNFNSTQDVYGVDSLLAALRMLRSGRGYYCTKKNRILCVPYEEIEYIQEDKDEQVS